MAAAVQQALNEQAGLGLKAVTAELDTENIYSLAGKLAGYEKTADALYLLDAPVVNFSQGVVDRTVEANVEFQGKTGLRPRVIRTMHGKGCPFCSGLAGAYDYPDVPKDVYRRHNNCRCTVTYDPGAGKRVQDVWSKRWTSAEERDKIEARKQVGENRKDTKKSRFNTRFDPMREILGSAEDSHPAEIKQLEEHLYDMGVTLKRPDSEQLDYQPSLVRGQPGVVHISQGASYSAWLHEVKHAEDDMADGWMGMHIFLYPEKCMQREKDAYQIEIDMAKSLGRKDIVKRLEALRDAEIRRYMEAEA